MQIHEYTGRIEQLIDQLAKETFAPGLYRPDKSWVLIEITRSAMNYVYLGRPKAFPLNVDWKYTLGKLELSASKNEILQERIRVQVLAQNLKSDLKENLLPAQGIKVTKSICSLEFTDTSVETQLKRVFALRSLTGYEKTVIRYKDSSTNSQDLKLEVSATGKASFYITYRLRGKDGKLGHQTAKVVANARTESVEQARQNAAHIRNTFIKKNKEVPATHFYENKAIKTFRELHEMQVRGERGQELKQSTVNEYDRIAFNYLGTKKDYLSYKAQRQTDFKYPNKKTKDYFVGIGILDRDFNSLTFTEAKKLHSQLRKAIEKNQHQNNKQPTGRQADKVFTYVRTLIDKGNLLMQEHDSSWDMRNSIILFSKEKTWVNPGGNSVRKDKTLPDQNYPTMWRGVQELRSYRLEKNESTSNLRNTKTDVRSYKLNSLFFEFLMFTGFRPEDAVRIEWSQVDLREGSITWKEEQRKNIKNHNGISDDNFVLFLNNQALKIVKALKSLYGQFCEEVSKPYDTKIQSLKDMNTIDFVAIKAVEQERDVKVSELACHRYLLCNAYLNNKMNANPSMFIDRLKESTGLRITAGSFRAMFQQKAAEVGLKDYEIKRLVFHKMNVNKADVQAGYNMTSASYLKRISQKVANKISSLCNAEFEQDTFMYIDSSMAKRIYAALDLEQKESDLSVELMSDDEYDAYVEAEQRTIEENAQMMLEDFLVLMKDPGVKSAVENLNRYKNRHYKLS
ncbi:hypothetical protein [Vibrio sp. 10N.261.54.A5]|uniref:hypothetical protein n=1 Tax=Vibrio sp. 10N.261.54.A5 TaxID=3229686 RepID=UPI00354EA918